MTETQTKWSERIREWRVSGQTAEAFAEGRDFKASTLRFWSSHIQTVARREGVPAARSRPVRILPVVRLATGPEPTVEVRVGAARVVVRKGFDRGLLRAVVEALGGES